MTLQRDVILVLLQECDVPHHLADLPSIDANVHGWWTKILARLALPGKNKPRRRWSLCSLGEGPGGGFHQTKPKGKVTRKRVCEAKTTLVEHLECLECS